MGLFDKVKDMLPKDKTALKGKAQDIAGKLDQQAEKLAQKDGKLGDLAAKAHTILDKVDTDKSKTTPPPPPGTLP
jgi:hypothetical protein